MISALSNLSSLILGSCNVIVQNGVYGVLFAFIGPETVFTLSLQYHCRAVPLLTWYVLFTTVELQALVRVVPSQLNSCQEIIMIFPLAIIAYDFTSYLAGEIKAGCQAKLKDGVFPISVAPVPKSVKYQTILSLQAGAIVTDPKVICKELGAVITGVTEPHKVTVCTS